MRFLLVFLVVTACSPPNRLCQSDTRVAPPAAACTASTRNLEYCTAPASGLFVTCTTGDCWGVRNDGPCFPPFLDAGVVVGCASGQSWKGRDCAGVDAGTRACFDLTEATCQLGCWYPIGVCLADGGRP